MLPFPLRAVWFALALSGLLSCWVVLTAYARTAKVFWSPVCYAVGVTVMEGVFCLGMIWHMDPARMPRGFCTAQPILITLGSYLLTGIAASYTHRTLSSSSFSPSSFRAPNLNSKCNSPRCLSPKIPIPTPTLLLAGSFALLFFAYVAVLLKLDAAVPSDGLVCDAVHPVWPRLLGYAGLPLAISIPSLSLSLYTAWRASHPSSQQSQLRLPGRSRSRSAANFDKDTFTRLPRPSPNSNSNSNRLTITPDPQNRPSSTPRAITIPSPSSSLVLTNPECFRQGRTPTSPRLSQRPQRYHLPFVNSPHPTPTPTPELRPPSKRSSVSDSTSISSVFPTFAPPSRPGSGGMPSLPAFPDRDEWDRTPRQQYRSGTGVEGEGESEVRWRRDSVSSASISKSQSDLDLEEGEGEDGEERDEWTSPTFHRRDPRDKLSSPQSGPSALAPTSTGPGPTLGSLIVFQIAFFLLSTLASISPLIDVISARQPPSAFGTQHVALLLVAWGPCIIFGHTPGIQERLFFWRRGGV